MTTAFRLKISNRFWSKVRLAGSREIWLADRDECFLWTASLDGHGYGQMWFPPQMRVVLASQVCWWIIHGEWPTKCVLHRCDNPRCVRPSHLFHGTRKQNTRDMIAKGRHSHGSSHGALVSAGITRGEDHHLATLTQQQAREIRRWYSSGDVSQAELGRHFGVTDVTISKVVRGLTYREAA